MARNKLGGERFVTTPLVNEGASWTTHEVTLYVTAHWPRPGQPALADWVSDPGHGVTCSRSLDSHRVGYRSGILRRSTVIPSILVTVLRGSLPPTTGNSKLSKNGFDSTGIGPVYKCCFDLATFPFAGAGDSLVA